jgi:hypothetical protein
MNDTAASPAAVHPFLDGKPKRMLVGGKWLEAASGKLRSNAGARCRRLRGRPESVPWSRPATSSMMAPVQRPAGRAQAGPRLEAARWVPSPPSPCSI